jgi:hypothetical protein
MVCASRPRIGELKTLVQTNWNEIGEIEFAEAVASYNGDFVIHFHHPVWRDDLT